MQQRYLNKAETANLLRISQRTLDRLIERGDGPKLIRLGSRRVIFARDEVIGWVERKEPEAEGANDE